MEVIMKKGLILLIALGTPAGTILGRAVPVQKEVKPAAPAAAAATAIPGAPVAPAVTAVRVTARTVAPRPVYIKAARKARSAHIVPAKRTRYGRARMRRGDRVTRARRTRRPYRRHLVR